MKSVKGKTGNTPKKTISFGVETAMDRQLVNMAAESGIKKSVLGRMALKEFLEGRCNEGQIMMNLTLLTQHLQNLSEVISSDEYEALQQYINNIMTLKGGNDHDSII